MLNKLIRKMAVYNPDRTTEHWEPGYQEVVDFEYKFKEYLEMKNKNVETEDILEELNQSEFLYEEKNDVYRF